MELPNFIDESLSQLRKACSPIADKLEGNFTSTRFLHILNVLEGRVYREQQLERSAEFKLLHD